MEPEIPHNTGNIARTCVAVGASLHICGQPGFSLSDKAVKRAGLDYWYELDLHLWDHFEDLYHAIPSAQYVYATTKADKVYSDISYTNKQVLLVFGKETKGLPESMLIAHPERCARIPMLNDCRSLNLSNAVAIMTYEVLRQNKFAGLLTGSDFLSNK